MKDEARFQALCERLRACWTGQGGTFAYPPATEWQVRASEAQLGFSLPPLLRLLYREVANGGNGLVWYDEEFPLVGAHGGYPFPQINWPDTGLWRPGVTIGGLVSRSGWRLHPCVEDAMWRHPNCYVFCDQPPDRFIAVSLESFGVLALDPVSGTIYQIAFEGALPLDDHQTRPMFSLQIYKLSLEDWLEEWLGHLGCGAKPAARAGPPNHIRLPPRELTPDLLDPACDADPSLAWHGLYRGVADALNPEEPAGADDLLTD
ncbi:MAG TPA: hypothetical protein VFQ25_02365 [Ktedonobacterales bacterium]|nr:hypothetical protein [Ktedonobacterales bacterium]